MKKRKVLGLAVVLVLVTSSFVIALTGEVAAQGDDGEIYATDENKIQTDNFPIGSELYFTIESDLIEETLEVQLRYEGSLMDSKSVETDNNGNYISAEEDVFFDLTGMSEGEYNLTISQTDGDFNSYFVNIYEQEFTEGSMVITTADDHEKPKDTFFAGETIYYYGEVKDQHDNPPVEHPYQLDAFVEYDDQENFVERNLADQEDGSFSGEFDINQEGNFTLIIRDLQDGDVEIANYTFTVMDIYFRVSIEPELNIYTQGQEIDLRVESDYPHNIDVAILNSLEEPYRLMDGALWKDQELINEFWSTEYTIPKDEEDGTYYVVVNSTETGETLEVTEFEIQKYSLEVETDKDVYHPGEKVKAYYTVENLLDGSPANNVNVSWRMYYITEDLVEVNSLGGEGVDGEFSETLPKDAAVNNNFLIRVWANDTEERYQEQEGIYRFVGDLNLDLNVELDEYIVGQTLYVELQTSTGNVEVEIELHYDDTVVDQKTVVTDSSGYYKVTMDLSGRPPGHYVVSGNATWNDMFDTDDDDFELIEESKRLSVMLERDKGVNPYYPEEEGMVFYTITRGGETVTNDANVKYRLYSNHRVLDKDFAEGGEIEFQVPSDYSPSSEGDLWIDVEATMDRETDGASTIRIPVSIGDILLNPDQWEYEGGDEINFEYEFHGIEENEVDSLEYRVLDDYVGADPEVIISGTPSDGVFEITIPEEPEDLYSVQLQAVTESGASIETTERINRISGFFLRTEIVTDSDYTTGVYEPGDEIEISYELVSRDERPLPETVTVGYRIQGYPESDHRFKTNETEGTFTLTVPELNDGEQVLSIQVAEEGNLEIIDVESDPSWGNRIVFGNVSVSGLIMTLLILLALILAGVGVLMAKSDKSIPKSKKRKPPKKPEETMESEEEVVVEEEGGEEFVIEEKREPLEQEWKDEPQIEPEPREEEE
ncbi:MAG: hypothetical protein KGY66_00950 [Candidatus Thermoplasmatota archaeon]|nr:hypothetical protein [Candidatus Thermoplasmatota archaeon]